MSEELWQRALNVDPSRADVCKWLDKGRDFESAVQLARGKEPVPADTVKFRQLIDLFRKAPDGLLEKKRRSAIRTESRLTILSDAPFAVGAAENVDQAGVRAWKVARLAAGVSRGRYREIPVDLNADRVVFFLIGISC